MRRTNRNCGKSHWTNFPTLATLAILLTGCFPADSIAQQQGQKTFSSPEDASNTLVSAAQRNDDKAMLEILGPEGKQIISSGDDAEDAENRANFARKYQEMHRLVKEPDGTTTLYIGAENWPTPIPLVSKDNSWYFDTEAGKQEILFRRVGENELSAIRVCQELVAAEKEFYPTQHNEYAHKIFSDEGQHNGLYWKAVDGEPQSPIGPLLASAVMEADGKTQDVTPAPFRGYYFHILSRQGKNGPGGAQKYFVNEKMTGGFAFVAFPAEYGSSGVMTFTVGEDGEVYQRDLGRKTETIARRMKEFNPSSRWQKAGDQPDATVSTQQNE